MASPAAHVDRLPGALAPAAPRCAVGVRVAPALLWEADGPVGLALRLVSLGVDALVVADPEGNGAALEPWEVATGARRPSVVRPLRAVHAAQDDEEALRADLVVLHGDAATRTAARERLAAAAATAGTPTPTTWDAVGAGELAAALVRPGTDGVVLAPASLGDLEAVGGLLRTRGGVPEHAAA